MQPRKCADPSRLGLVPNIQSFMTGTIANVHACRLDLWLALDIPQETEARRIIRVQKICCSKHLSFALFEINATNAGLREAVLGADLLDLGFATPPPPPHAHPHT